MTIEEIVERKLNEHFEQLEDRELATGFGLAVAKAVVGECAKVADEHVGNIRWDSSYPVDVAATIRALAAQGTGGEKGK